MFMAYECDEASGNLLPWPIWNILGKHWLVSMEWSMLDACRASLNIVIDICFHSWSVHGCTNTFFYLFYASLALMEVKEVFLEALCKCRLSLP